MAGFIPLGAVNSIASNVAAQSTARVLTENTFLLQKSLARLSSGLRIISAGDDPVGAANAVRIGAQISRVSAAQTNITNATSYVETQSGFLNQVEDALDRMSELATLSQDGLTTDSQRSEYQEEFVDLQEFVSTVGTRTFNGIDIFSSSNLSVTIDPDGGTFTLDALNYNEAAVDGGLAEVYDGIDISSVANAGDAADEVELGIDNLSFMLARAGSHTQRLTLSNEALTVESENLTSMHESITLTDTAAEAVRYAQLQLLVNAGTAMLVQANLNSSKLIDLLDFK